MSDERELKFAVDDLTALRQRLRAAGATELHAESFETNELWDREGELRAGGSLLRLRTDGAGCRVTFKGPPRFDKGVKVRIEHETAIASSKRMAAVLAALGYSPVYRYEKYRAEWQLGDVVVALDRTPMGDFAEFEGPAAAAAAGAAGCAPETALEEDYLGLYESWRREHPNAPEFMVFAEQVAADD